jgi:hypothetical protein
MTGPKLERVPNGSGMAVQAGGEGGPILATTRGVCAEHRVCLLLLLACGRLKREPVSGQIVLDVLVESLVVLRNEL